MSTRPVVSSDTNFVSAEILYCPIDFLTIPVGSGESKQSRSAPFALFAAPEAYALGSNGADSPFTVGSFTPTYCSEVRGTGGMCEDYRAQDDGNYTDP